MKNKKQQTHKVGELVRIDLYGLGIVVGEGESNDFFDLDGTGTFQRTSQYVYLFSREAKVPVFVEYICPTRKEQRT